MSLTRFSPSISQSTRHRKESLTVTKTQKHLFNRRESTRRISNAICEQTSSQSERKSSRSSHHDGALSVLRLIHAARTWKRFSNRHHTIQEKPKRRLQNTYRLGPDPEQVFSAAKVKVVIEEVLNRLLKNFRYSSDDSKDKCLLISSEILSSVKQMDFRRYKIVCNVTIMQNKGQGSEVASRCVWDSEMDSTASLTHTTEDIVCVASVHAVYFE